MKTMTCKQLGGACNEKFSAATFEEIAEMSRKHGAEMFQRSDDEHLKAMDEMRILMQDPSAMQNWFEGKRREFESLPDD
jgi:hypothetical protein